MHIDYRLFEKMQVWSLGWQLQLTKHFFPAFTGFMNVYYTVDAAAQKLVMSLLWSMLIYILFQKHISPTSKASFLFVLSGSWWYWLNPRHFPSSSTKCISQWNGPFFLILVVDRGYICILSCRLHDMQEKIFFVVS